MKRGTSISTKILLLALLNVVLLAVVFLSFAKLQLRLELHSFLLAQAQERIISVSRLVALQLPDRQQSEWTKILEEDSRRYPAKLYLFEEGGKQLAGEAVTLPPELMRRLRHAPSIHVFFGPGPPPPRPPDVPPEPAPPGIAHRPAPRAFRHGGMSDAPLQVVKTSNPAAFWIGVMIPIWTPDRQDPIHASLVWRVQSFWTQPFFFDWRPWVTVVLVVLFVSGLCWVPLVRGMTKAVSQMTQATRRIADGHFDVKLPAARRDELGLLSDSINRMSERLSGYVYGQKRFLGDIAHELSSPIARMHAALGILEQRAHAGEAHYVTDVSEEVEHMSALVNELLQFSKAQVSEKHLPLQTVNVLDAVRTVLERERVEAHQVEVQIAEGLSAYVHRECFSRAIANVLRNAVRYAGHAGAIGINAAEVGDLVVVSVTDRGPGIPENELENVFRPFYRPESARQRSTGGAGLGLAIVRDCIESCGGRVQLRNQVPHGLDVRLEVPAAAAAN